MMVLPTAFYSKLEREYEPRLTGIKDGSAQAFLERKSFVDKIKYDYYLNYFLSYKGDWFYNQTKFPDEDFDLQFLKLKKSAILTDFLYFGPAYYHKFLVNRKVRELLNRFKVAPFKYYDARLYSKSEQVDDYKFLFTPSFGYDIVDFEMSIFSISDAQREKSFLNIKSRNEFTSLLEQHEAPIDIEKLVLKNSFQKDLDYFNTLALPTPIISKRLRDELLKQNISGIRMTELDETRFEIS
jgi:hypothetical protein